jgi:hypothetical protein
MKKPQMVSGEMSVVVDIPGGGAEEHGRAIVIEFEMLDGKTNLFQFTRSTADKLISATQRFLFEAQHIAGQRDQIDEAAAITIASSMMSFRYDPDGSKGMIVIRGTGGPPVLIEVMPEDFLGIRNQLDNIELLMSEKRKSRLT